MELITINTNDKFEQVVSGRELHEKLEVKSKYLDWFGRMVEYGFVEDIDFVDVNELAQKKEGSRLVKREQINHIISIEMAKQLCMLARNEKGMQFRKYFIEIEKAWNDPTQVMARALQIANKTIEECKTNISNLQLENKSLTKEVEHKEDVIIGLVTDIDLATKRQRITQVVKNNTKNYKDRYNLLYKEFELKYHMNLNRRLESETTLAIKPKIKNKMDFIDRGLGMIPELYEIACVLFETDMQEIIKRFER
ncbi:MAG: antA/AntB antirepressor family protein [Clostridium sp.]|uniref:antA/AntB antirepressor family protein n=1 Tax=Clostridium sp. TaxID=1506 RepID=UPI003EE7DDD1